MYYFNRSSETSKGLSVGIVSKQVKPLSSGRSLQQVIALLTEFRLVSSFESVLNLGAFSIGGVKSLPLQKDGALLITETMTPADVQQRTAQVYKHVRHPTYKRLECCINMECDTHKSSLMRVRHCDSVHLGLAIH